MGNERRTEEHLAQSVLRVAVSVRFAVVPRQNLCWCATCLRHLLTAVSHRYTSRGYTPEQIYQLYYARKVRTGKPPGVDDTTVAGKADKQE